jgi:Transposase DDE domain
MGFPFLCVASLVRQAVAVSLVEAAYGYCAAKKQIYYGFHGHLLVSATGVITGFSLTPANGSERDALWDMVQTIHGLIIGDKGYLSAPLQHELRTCRR